MTDAKHLFSAILCSLLARTIWSTSCPTRSEAISISMNSNSTGLSSGMARDPAAISCAKLHPGHAEHSSVSCVNKIDFLEWGTEFLYLVVECEAQSQLKQAS
jgi:hypothetical protein